MGQAGASLGRADRCRHGGRVAIAAVALAACGAAADDAGQWPVGTAETMWEEPYLVGSYRHWDEIFPVRVVEAGGSPSALPAGEPLGPIEYWHDGERRTLDDHIADARLTGIIVVKDGLVRLERYAHGADQTSLLTSQSVAKSVVSTLVGIALGEGLIASLEEPIDTYVPELAVSGYAGVPIEAVLQMSSGIAFDEDYSDGSSDSERLWLATAQARTVPVEDYLLRMEAEAAPYQRFNYKGVDTLALAWLVERVSGMTLSAYLSEKLWRPAGMEADATWGLDGEGPDASEIAFCCLNARLRDWARFGLVMARDGVWNGRRVLPEGWVDRATVSSRDQVMPGRLYRGYALGYQYQWWTFAGDPHAFVAQGINGQFVYVDPSQDLVVAATAVWRDWWDDDLERELYAIARRAGEMAAGDQP